MKKYDYLLSNLYNILEIDELNLINILNIVENEMEAYFNKAVYLSDVYRFVEDDKKVSISYKLFKILEEKIANYMKKKKTKNPMFLLNKLVVATPIKENEKSYFLVEKISEIDCYFNKRIEQTKLTLGKEYVFFCYKIKNQFAYLSLNNTYVAKYYLNPIFDKYSISFKVKKYKKNELLNIIFYGRDKLPKSLIKEIKGIFPNEKIVYNPKIKLKG